MKNRKLLQQTSKLTKEEFLEASKYPERVVLFYDPDGWLIGETDYTLNGKPVDDAKAEHIKQLGNKGIIDVIHVKFEDDEQKQDEY